MPGADTTTQPTTYPELARLVYRLRYGVGIRNARGANRVITQGIARGHIMQEDEVRLRDLVPKYYTRERHVGETDPAQQRLAFGTPVAPARRESHRGAESILRKLKEGNYSRRSLAVTSAMTCRSISQAERAEVLRQIHVYFDDKEGMVAPADTAVEVPPPPPVRSIQERDASLLRSLVDHDCRQSLKTVNWLTARLRLAAKVGLTLADVIDLYTTAKTPAPTEEPASSTQGT